LSIPKKHTGKASSKSQFTVKELYTLDGLDMKIVQHLAEYPATTHQELAKLLDLKIEAVRYRMKKPSVLNAMELVARKFDDLVTDAKLAAMRRLTKILNNSSSMDKDAIQAARVIFDREKATLIQNNVNMDQHIIVRTSIGDGGMLNQEVIDCDKDFEIALKYLPDSEKEKTDDHDEGSETGAALLQDE